MSRSDWRTMTPAEVLDAFPVLTIEQVAFVLGLTHGRGVHRGEPDRRQVDRLIHEGRLRLVDPSMSVTRWTVSNAIVRAYIAGEPMPSLLRQRVAS